MDTPNSWAVFGAQRLTKALLSLERLQELRGALRQKRLRAADYDDLLAILDKRISALVNRQIGARRGTEAHLELVERQRQAVLMVAGAASRDGYAYTQKDAFRVHLTLSSRPADFGLDPLRRSASGRMWSEVPSEGFIKRVLVAPLSSVPRASEATDTVGTSEVTT